MTDIVERLRNAARIKGYGLHAEAADEILRLRSELEQAQQALQKAPDQPVGLLETGADFTRRVYDWHANYTSWQFDYQVPALSVRKP